MSGHSKWATTKRHKAVIDAKRRYIFTKHAKLIALAAQKGGDPNANASLRLAIDKAKADNMPNANIERAVKKGSGELKDGNQIEELYYEAYGPGGAALYIQALSDNKNRTASNLRTILNNNHGRLAESGSVAFLFEKRAVFIVDLNTVINRDELELALIDLGVSEIDSVEEEMMVSADYTLFGTIKSYFEEHQLKLKSSAIQFVPKMTIDLSPEHNQQLQELLHALDADDDINEVASNA